MKIIVVGPDYSKYNAASYQYEFMNSLNKYLRNIFIIQKIIEIEEEQLYKKSKFVHLMSFFINHGWLQDNPSVKKLTYIKINKKFEAIKTSNMYIFK